MIVASLLLVIAAAVTLLVGLFNREQIEWVYASIGSCLLAGVLLTIGVLRSRPSRKPVLQSGSGQNASWAGASGWGGAAGEGQGATDVLTRDDEEPVQAPEPVGDDEPTRTSLATAPPAEPESIWAPEDDDDTGDVRVVSPPVADEPPDTPEADEDVVVVPKPSSRPEGVSATDAGAGAAAAPTVEESGVPGAEPVESPAAATAPAATGSSEDAARFEQVLKPITGVGPAKRRALLEHFGTYRKLRAATPEKLAEVQGISPALAQRIHDALHTK